MTVQELIEILESYDPEAKVLLMTQQTWPFENTLRGVASRQEVAAAICFHPSEMAAWSEDPDACEECHEGECYTHDGIRSNDIFLVEGTQLRYGTKAAWEVV